MVSIAHLLTSLDFTWSMCFLKVSLLSMMIPRYLACSFSSTGSPLMVMFIGGDGCLLLCLKSKTFDLPTFKLSLLAINQFDT